ncbi:hypothetical protein FRACYDRAFT_244079 [Fragilariopsis cylindrus CCMP1102]|uniref:Uncharacterized protein n=1 Tax=Fragilariopsis cylindrus CCMP1102 TaxID=635003 RepID=A0A1E7F3U9_9STRA|nr:hypothetical protein FRACYDRAFT_244079 [Fragilariopsis cylindrus CCMP1102]|eukprot:OEU12804.1 hypothetical protein FRACYDRAFT_244079 [Fragilariopsis cylindrus CCMP1102]
MSVPLHPPPLGCSEFLGDTNNDGVIACRPDKTSDDEDPLGLLLGLSSEATGQSAQSVPGNMPRVSQSESIEKAKPPPPAKKRGRRKGSVTTFDITRGQWYHACKKYRELLVDGSVKMSHSQFLRSDQTEQVFTNTISQRQAFGRWLKKYDDGSLQDSSAKREKIGKFTEIEDQLLSYLDSQAQAHRSDNCGITWVVMQEMCRKWAEERNIVDFKCSTGWLNATLNKRQTKKKGDDVTEAMQVIKSHIISSNFSQECLTDFSSLEESMQLERLQHEPNKKKRRQKQPPCKKQPSLSSHIGNIHGETI